MVRMTLGEGARVKQAIYLVPGLSSDVVGCVSSGRPTWRNMDGNMLTCRRRSRAGCCRLRLQDGKA